MPKLPASMVDHIGTSEDLKHRPVAVGLAKENAIYSESTHSGAAPMTDDGSRKYERGTLFSEKVRAKSAPWHVAHPSLPSRV